jgi:hypothetical protein
VPSDGDGSLEARIESTYDLERMLAAGDLWADDEKFISAESTDVVVGAKPGPHPPRRGNEDRVAGGVPVSVVRALEVIEVDEDDGEPVTVRRGFLNREFEKFESGTSVEAAGQRVDVRSDLQLAAEPNTVGNVTHATDRAGDNVSAVGQRTQAQQTNPRSALVTSGCRKSRPGL